MSQSPLGKGRAPSSSHSSRPSATPSPSSSLILITGVSGLLGFRTLALALRADYFVVATVRRQDQVAKIVTSPSIGPHINRVTFVVVEDMTAPRAFEKAMKGVTHVIHIASPVTTSFTPDANGAKPDFRAHFYDPAVKGTLGLLFEAAEQPSVCRFIITSSIVVLEPPEGRSIAGPYDAKAYPGDDVANQTTDPLQAYTCSKILAQQAATLFAQRNAPCFELVRIMPGVILGFHELAESAEDLKHGSIGKMISTALGEMIEGPKLTAQVHLDDVARAHILALNPKYAYALHSARGFSFEIQQYRGP